jgi:hypothetical protein
MTRATTIFRTLILFFVLQLATIGFASAQTVWLDELDLSTATQGYACQKRTNRAMAKRHYCG